MVFLDDRLPNFSEDFPKFPEYILKDHGIVGLHCSNNMAARFPASASMQKMANNPQQASMFQRSQFQQSPYGMAVRFLDVWLLWFAFDFRKTTPQLIPSNTRV